MSSLASIFHRFNGAPARIRAGLAGIFLCSLLVAASCEKGPDGGVAHVDTKVLHRGNGGEPGSLDPVLATDIHAFNVLVDLYEGLIAEAADGSLIPGVADAWRVSEDGLVYTFTLRSDVRWSDGSRVVASDFVDSLRRVVAPATASPYSFLLEPLAQFEDIQTGDAPAASLGVVAESDATLVMTLSRPTAHWLSILALPIAYPTKRSYDGGMLTNGPYTLIEHQLDSVIRLAKNEHYWSAESVAIDEIVHHAIVDPLAEFNMYRTGELDITHIIPSEQVTALQADRPDEVRIAPSLALYYLAFDLTEAPLTNRSLRAALSMAIDRQTLVKVIGRGEQPAHGIVPPGVADYESASYDWHAMTAAERTGRAKVFYAEAGYGPENPLQIQLTYDVGDIHEKVALAVASMWREELGVEVALEKMEWKLLLDTRDQRSEWQVMRFAWFGDYNAPGTFLEIFESHSLQNLPLYRSKNFDQLLSAARIESNRNTSAELMREAEQQLLDDYPIAPLYFFVSKHLVRPGISGFEDNVLDRHPSRFLDMAQ